MVRFIRRVALIWLLFIIVSIFAGGDIFREANAKVGLFSEKAIEMIAGKADGLKEDAENIKSYVKRVALGEARGKEGFN